MSKLWLPGQPLTEPEPQSHDDELPPVLIGAPHDHVATDLSWQDRQRLRVVALRNLRAAGCPPEHCTIAEADKYIDSLLRETAEKMIKRAVDAKLA